MRVWICLLAAVLASAMALAGAARGDVVPGAVDGTWHGKFSCVIFRPGIIAPGSRDAAFEFAVAGGKASVSTRLNDVGQLQLQVGFEQAGVASLVLAAQSGDTTWPPFTGTEAVALADNRVQWAFEWDRAKCQLVLAPGAQPAESDAAIDEPNDPAGMPAIRSARPNATLVPAPNDPETRGAVQAPRISASDVEIVFWESVRDSKDPAELGAYLERYPNGAYAVLAHLRLARLHQP